MIIGILIKCPATFKMTPERCLYYAWKNIETKFHFQIFFRNVNVILHVEI